MLSPEYQAQIRQLASSSPDKEICGLVLDNGLYPCVNVDKMPDKYFKIAYSEIKQAAETGKIQGVYHSHSSGDDFSTPDIYISERTGLPYFLYVNKSDLFKEHIPQGLEIPYLGRPFLLGVFDCLILAMDYYKKELNIIVKDIVDEFRFEGDWTKHPANVAYQHILYNHLLTQGFVEVKKLKKHDLILVKAPGFRTPIHCAIYLGDNKILHHPRDKYSLIEDYSLPYKTTTTFILRHGSMR